MEEAADMTDGLDSIFATDAQGFPSNNQAAKDGGKVAGDARKALERKTGQRVLSESNFLPEEGKQNKLPS